jgi:hypothetical protein
MEDMNGCCSFARCAGGRLVHLLSTGAFLQEEEKRAHPWAVVVSAMNTVN